MLDISYSSSKPTIIKGTEQKLEKKTAEYQQSIDVPSSWFGSRSGGYRHLKRKVLVIGTIEVKKYNTVHRVRYGTTIHKDWTVLVVEDCGRWLAFDRRPETGLESIELR